LENQEEINTFLNACDLPKLNQKGIKHSNRSTTSNDTKAVIKNLSTKGNTGPDRSTAELPDLYRSTNTNNAQTIP
jgi:hypothetical protein